MDLSVILVNWNTKDLLLPCLEALYRTVRKLEMEVYVVDNGSNDGSGAAALEQFPGVILIENEMNLGFARASNQALKAAQGDYLLLLNPDTEVKEGAIETLLSFLKSCPNAGVAGPQLLNSDGSKQNSVANFPSLATELLNKSLLRRLWPEKFPGKERHYADPIRVESVIGACMMVRRRALHEVGLLDEDYFLFLEETDWCYRMVRAGWQVYHVPQAEVYHFQGKSAAPEKARAKIEYYRSRYLFFRKQRGAVRSAILVMGVLVRLSVELISMTVACFLTVFSVRKWREKLSVLAYVMWWHLRLCPKGMGLKKTNHQ